MPILVNLSYLPWVPGRRKRNEALFFYLLRDAGLFSRGVFVNPFFSARNGLATHAVGADEVFAGTAGSTPFIVTQPIVRMPGQESHVMHLAEAYAALLRHKYIGDIPYVLWMNTAEPLEYYLAKSLLHQATLRVFDLSDDFTTFAHSNPPRFQRCLCELLRSSDAVLCVNEHVAKKFPHKNSLVFCNGTDCEHFQSWDPHFTLAPYFPKPQNTVYLGYIGGVIRERIDRTLLAVVLKRFSSCQLLCVGYYNSRELINWIVSHKNAHYVREVPYGYLPSLIRQFDVGIVPHVITEFTHGNDLLKIHDYLACGVPVVSSPCSNVEKFGAAVAVGRTHAEFCEHIDTILRSGPMCDPELGRAIADRWSWARRVGPLASWLGDSLDRA